MDAPRRRGGRPRKAPEERRAVRLSGPRVTPAVALEIEERAAQAGLIVPEFMLRAALGQPLRPRAPAAADRLLIELNRIGNNLNQITARMHLTGELALSLLDTLAELRTAMAKVVGRDP